MTDPENIKQGLHQGLPLRTLGDPLGQAHAAMLMVHGRGASAADILLLANQITVSEFAYLAPEAAGDVWYPNRFSAPIASNEPWLSSALARVGEVLDQIAAAGIPPERTILLGFSQGACLVLEYAARNPRRYGGLIGLSGALIGPDDAPRDYPGSLAGTPVFLGCSDVDPHVPKERVLQASEVLQRLGGEVMVKLYENEDHTVNDDEIHEVRRMMAAVLPERGAGG